MGGGGVYHEINPLTSSSTVESSLFLIDDDSSNNENYKECIDHFYCACRSTHS